MGSPHSLEWFEVGIFRAHVEARALFCPFGGRDASVAVEVGREVAVAEECGLRESFM